MDWDGMDGDGVVRFCRRCEKNVHDLSAMGEEAARAFLAAGGSPCVRAQVDGQGRMLFVSQALALLPKVAAAAALTLGVAAGGGCLMGKPMQGYGGCPVKQPSAVVAEGEADPTVDPAAASGEEGPVAVGTDAEASEAPPPPAPPPAPLR